jgi:hypothetical protein
MSHTIERPTAPRLQPTAPTPGPAPESVSASPSAPDRRGQPVISPAETHAVEVYDTYNGVLEHLPGVRGVSADQAGLHIQAKSKASAKLLGDLLEHSIRGVPVSIQETPGEAKPPVSHPRHSTPGAKPGHKDGTTPRVQLSPAERVEKRYGKILRGLPHVVGVERGEDTTSRVPGQSPHQSIVIVTDTPQSIPFLDDLLEDSLNGVLVQFEPRQSAPAGA